MTKDWKKIYEKPKYKPKASKRAKPKDLGKQLRIRKNIARQKELDAVFAGDHRWALLSKNQRRISDAVRHLFKLHNEQWEPDSEEE